nr:hypothetical protein [Tanacetum cinerariifolium]
MTGPAPDPVTPMNQVTRNDDNLNNLRSLQDQILDHMSSLKILIKQHNEKSGTLIEPIRLTFGDEEEGDKAKAGGKRTEEEKDEDLQKPYKEIYDGSIDPDNHVTRFIGAANQGEWQMPVWCRMFQQTLDGPARDPTEVSKIIRRANKTLLDFKECWTEEMSYIQDVPEMISLNPKRLTKALSYQGEFPKKGQGTSYRGNRPPRVTYEGGKQRRNNYNNFNRRDNYQPYVPSRANNRSEEVPTLEDFPTASEEVFPLLSHRDAPAEDVCIADEVKTAWPIVVRHKSEKTAWPIMVRHTYVKMAWPSVRPKRT